MAYLLIESLILAYIYYQYDAKIMEELVLLI